MADAEDEAPQQIEVGEVVSLGLDAPESEGPVRFTSSNARLLQVDAGGTVRALAAGTAAIMVITGDATIVVQFIITEPPRRASRLVVRPAVVDIEVGGTITLAVTAEDDSPGKSFLLPGDVQWRSDDESVVSCSPSGMLTAHKRGRVLVRAQADALTGACTVSVVPAIVARLVIDVRSMSFVAGETGQVAVSAYDRRGNRVSGAPLTFESSDRGIVRVSANGLAEAVSAGNATVHARCGDLEAMVDVTVTPVPIASVEVALTSLTLEVGDSFEMRAIALDADEVELVGRALVWHAENADVVRVTAAGLLTAVAPGRGSVHVSGGGVRQTVEVTVSSVPLRELVITPSDVATVVGRDVQLLVQATDVRGRPAAAPEIDWTSEQPSVATVLNGQLHASTAGSTVVTAHVGDISASVRVQVSAAVAASLSISGPTKPVRVGGPGLLSAEVVDIEGFAIEGLPVEWSSDAPDIATVDTLGLVRGIAAGNVTVTATAGALSTSKTLAILSARTSSLLFIGAVVALVVLALGYAGLRGSFGRRAGAGPDSTSKPPLQMPVAKGESPGVGSGAAKTAGRPTGVSDTLPKTVFNGAIIRVGAFPPSDTVRIIVGQRSAIQAFATSNDRFTDSGLVVWSKHPTIVAMKHDTLIRSDGIFLRETLRAKSPGRAILWAGIPPFYKQLVVIVRDSAAPPKVIAKRTDTAAAPPTAASTDLPELTEQDANTALRDLLNDRQKFLDILTASNATKVLDNLERLNARERKTAEALTITGLALHGTSATALVTFPSRVKRSRQRDADCVMKLELRIVFRGQSVGAITVMTASGC